MFKITLNYTPSLTGEATSISANGSTLTYNGTNYDFSSLPDGAQVEASHPATGIIKNVGGVIHLTVEYHVPDEEADSMQSTDINDYIVNLSSGALQCPIKRRVANV